jgi:hypothetical protein
LESLGKGKKRAKKNRLRVKNKKGLKVSFQTITEQEEKNKDSVFFITKIITKWLDVARFDLAICPSFWLGYILHPRSRILRPQFPLRSHRAIILIP